MRGTWRKKHSDFEISFSYEFFLLKFVRAQPAGALFCIQPAAVLPLWGCCPALPWLGSPPCALHCSWPGVSGDQPPTPPPPTSHIPPQPRAPPTKQLRCNYLGRRSPHRKHRGGWSHAATPPHCPPPWHCVTQPFKKPQSSACAGRWEVTIN